MELVTLYKNALKCIDNIYRVSQYDADTDMFRIPDIINATNDSQIQSKQWLVDELSKITTEQPSWIVVAGSWYGCLGPLLADAYGEDVRIDLCDIDPHCKKIGRDLLKDIGGDFRFKTADALEWFISRLDKVSILINTSCEHMERDDVKFMVQLKNPDTIIAFQSNDYTSVMSHINTSPNLEDFIDYLNLDEVLWSGTLPHPHKNYNRFMVIGK